MKTKLSHSSREIMQLRQEKRNIRPGSLPKVDIFKIIWDVNPANPVAKSAFEAIEKASKTYVSSVIFK